MITLAEIQAACGLELLASGDYQAIADSVNAGRTTVKEYWLTDRGLVSDLVTATGNTDLADSILTKLDGLAANSRSTKAMLNRLENDARGVNFGDAALRAQFQYLGSVGVFTDAEVAAVLALAVQPDPVTALQIATLLTGGA